MPDQPTPDQRATDIANATGIRGPVIWAIARDAALAAILQSDQQQAELLAQAEAMAAALEPFAKITPSSFYPPDGSEAEGYTAIVADSIAGGFVEFTGADLVRARTAFREYQQGGRSDG